MRQVLGGSQHVDRYPIEEVEMNLESALLLLRIRLVYASVANGFLVEGASYEPRCLHLVDAGASAMHTRTFRGRPTGKQTVFLQGSPQ